MKACSGCEGILNIGRVKVGSCREKLLDDFVWLLQFVVVQASREKI